VISSFEDGDILGTEVRQFAAVSKGWRSVRDVELEAMISESRGEWMESFDLTSRGHG